MYVHVSREINTDTESELQEGRGETSKDLRGKWDQRRQGGRNWLSWQVVEGLECGTAYEEMQ